MKETRKYLFHNYKSTWFTSPTCNYALHVYKKQVENLFLKLSVGPNVQIERNHLQTLNFKGVGVLSHASKRVCFEHKFEAYQLIYY